MRRLTWADPGFSRGGIQHQSAMCKNGKRKKCKMGVWGVATPSASRPGSATGLTIGQFRKSFDNANTVPQRALDCGPGHGQFHTIHLHNSEYYVYKIQAILVYEAQKAVDMKHQK